MDFFTREVTLTIFFSVHEILLTRGGEVRVKVYAGVLCFVTSHSFKLLRDWLERQSPPHKKKQFQDRVINVRVLWKEIIFECMMWTILVNLIGCYHKLLLILLFYFK
jgi:hypothetical protein